jgi:hypothetical protein
VSETTPTKLPVAHIELRDVWVAIVFLDSESSPKQQHEIHAALQECIRREGLQGSLVTMWKDSNGARQFIAEPAQRPFFESVRYDQLYAQRNRTITWPDR